MAVLSNIALIGGLLLSAAGTGIQFQASQQAAEAQEKSIEAQKKSEAIRQRQMSLESDRRKREIIRQSIIARSAAQSQATAQGASQSTVLPGALGSITGQAASGYNATTQAENLGNQMFASNVAQLNASRDLADAQSFGAVGTGLASLGGALSKNLGPIGRLTYGL